MVWPGLAPSKHEAMHPGATCRWSTMTIHHESSEEFPPHREIPERRPTPGLSHVHRTTPDNLSASTPMTDRDLWSQYHDLPPPPYTRRAPRALVLSRAHARVVLPRIGVLLFLRRPAGRFPSEDEDSDPNAPNPFI